MIILDFNGAILSSTGRLKVDAALLNTQNEHLVKISIVIWANVEGFSNYNSASLAHSSKDNPRLSSKSTTPIPFVDHKLLFVAVFKDMLFKIHILVCISYISSLQQYIMHVVFKLI